MHGTAEQRCKKRTHVRARQRAVHAAQPATPPDGRCPRMQPRRGLGLAQDLGLQGSGYMRRCCSASFYFERSSRCGVLIACQEWARQCVVSARHNDRMTSHQRAPPPVRWLIPDRMVWRRLSCVAQKQRGSTAASSAQVARVPCQGHNVSRIAFLQIRQALSVQ